MSNTVQVIIVNYKTADLVKRCVESLFLYTKPGTITVVDNSEDFDETELLVLKLKLNDSIDGKGRHWFKKQSGITLELIRSSSNIGFGGGCNIGVFQSIAPRKKLWFLNSDCVLFNDALSPLVRILSQDNQYNMISSVIASDKSNSKIRSQDLEILVSGVSEFLGLFFNTQNRNILRHNKFILESDYVYGASFIMYKNDFVDVKGFDESYFMYLEETDLVFRIKKRTKKKCCFSTKSIVIHSEGGSQLNTNKQDLIIRNYLKFVKKNYSGILLLMGYIWYLAKNIKNYLNVTK